MQTCPICKVNEDPRLLRNYRNEHGNFTLYECLRCNAQFWTPLKSLGAEWYNEKNPYAIQESLVLKVSREYHANFLDKYGNDLKGEIILDVGCGSGEFLAELQKRGAQVWGIDFNGIAIEIAKRHFNLHNVFQTSLEEFSKRSDIPAFDTITFFEVLQYSQDPTNFVQLIKNLIKPTGRIYLSVPERGRIFASFDQWDFPPNHLTRWNRKSLEHLFERVGLEILSLIHLEELKILMGSVNGRFRFGLVKKAIIVSKNKQTLKSFSRFLYVVARIKEYVVGFIPATFLFL